MRPRRAGEPIGRPSVDGTRGSTPPASFKLGTAKLARLDAEASRRGVQRSALIRAIITDWLDQTAGPDTHGAP